MFDLNLEILDKSREAVNGILEFQSLFMELFSFWESVVHCESASSENTVREPAFVHDYIKGTEELARVIRDYISCLENAEENGRNESGIIMRDRQMISALEKRSCFNGKDFNELENYFDLEYGVQKLTEKYKSLVLLLNCLNECIKEHLSELEVPENDISMACVYAPPEMMSNGSQEVSRDRTYPYLYSDVNENNKDAQTTIEDYNKQTGNNSQDTVRFCPQCGTANGFNCIYCVNCGNEIQKRSIQDSPSMICVYASPEFMSEKRKKDGFFKQLFKRR